MLLLLLLTRPSTMMTCSFLLVRECNLRDRCAATSQKYKLPEVGLRSMHNVLRHLKDLFPKFYKAWKNWKRWRNCRFASCLYRRDFEFRQFIGNRRPTCKWLVIDIRHSQMWHSSVQESCPLVRFPWHDPTQPINWVTQSDRTHRWIEKMDQHQPSVTNN